MWHFVVSNCLHDNDVFKLIHEDKTEAGANRGTSHWLVDVRSKEIGLLCMYIILMDKNELDFDLFWFHLQVTPVDLWDYWPV